MKSYVPYYMTVMHLIIRCGHMAINNTSNNNNDNNNNSLINSYDMAIASGGIAQVSCSLCCYIA